MSIVKNLVTSAAAILLVVSAARAQEQTPTSGRAATTVTAAAAAAADRVRFTGPDTVVQMRLEVYAANGEKVFDNEIKGGNVIDWRLQDGQAQRLSDGSYLCVITSKSLSGRMGQRSGTLTIENSSARVRALDTTLLTAQQTQAVGPLEENAALTVVNEDESQTATFIAHDGRDGQIIRGRGALSFRIGDFFSGKDTEQMRLTPEGNLGIGITNPTVRLEVDGLIRASQGIVFPDGSIQYSASRKTFGADSLPPGQSQKKHAKGDDFETAAVDVGGTGTTGSIPKWQDGPGGVLNDSNITEVSGAIGVNGAPNTSFRLDVNGSTRIRGSNPGFNLEGLSAGGNIWLFQTVDDNGRFRLFGQNNTNPGIERLTIILGSGNIGISAPAPAAKLDVAGDIRSFILRQELTPTSPNVIAGFLGTGPVGATPGNRVTGGVAGATIGGGGFNGSFNLPSGTPVTGDNSNRVTDWFGTVGGGFHNRAGDDSGALDSAPFATVGGGRSNSATFNGSTVGGGDSNIASELRATVSGGEANTASGNHSTVGGGEVNMASGTDTTVGGGVNNTAGDARSTVGGGLNNTAGGLSATIAGGESNTTSGPSATIGGGKSNTASGFFSVVPGGQNAAATHYGEMAFSSDNFSSPGDAQTSVYTLTRVTSNGQSTELFLDQFATQRITIATDRTFSFDILVVAKTAAGQSAGYTIRGVIKNVGSVVSFVGTPTVTVLGEDVAAWNVTVEADDAHNALVVTASGFAATTIRWVATVRTTEVSF